MNLNGRQSQHVQVLPPGQITPVNNFGQTGPSPYTLNRPTFYGRIQEGWRSLFGTPVAPPDPFGRQAMEEAIRNFGTPRYPAVPVNQAAPPILRQPQQFYGRTPTALSNFLGL